MNQSHQFLRELGFARGLVIEGPIVLFDIPMVASSASSSNLVENRMLTTSKYDLALSMMRQWGKDARYSARNYAIDGFRKGDTAEFCKWHDVGRIIEQMEANGIIAMRAAN